MALAYFARRDLLGEEVGPVDRLWRLPKVEKVLKKQSADGSWPRRGEQKHPAIDYPLIETWRQIRVLVDQYGITRDHPQVQRAAEFVFFRQTPQGDIRGFLANQYAPYYTGALLGILIRAGYADDPRVEAGMRWLLSMRQDDLGWTIPLLTHTLDRATQYRLTSEYAEPVEPDRSRPFSHNWTGMVLRAFAAHPTYRQSQAAWTAGQLLKSRFFQPDAYTSYRAAGYWVRFGYPFWWNDLVSALDSLSLIGFSSQDEQMQQALQWLVAHQQADGLWRESYAKATAGDPATTQELRIWVSLAICRVLRRLSPRPARSTV